MSIFEAIILGIVEGVTEFLPVSSTGHLILASQLLGLSQTDAVKSFEIVIQLGAICAVLALYGRALVSDTKILKAVLVGFVPTGLVGLFLYPFIKDVLIGSIPIVLAALFLGGVAMIALEMWYGKKELSKRHDITLREAFYIGLFQAVSVIPGVSRAGATILGGLSLGISREAIVRFSFLLAVPTILAAAGYDLIQTAGSFSQGDTLALVVGFATAFATALFAIKAFIGFVQRHSFVSFGVYRILLALVLAMFWYL